MERYYNPPASDSLEVKKIVVNKEANPDCCDNN